MPLSWIFQCYLIDDVKASAAHSQIAHAEARTLGDDPQRAGAGRGAEPWVLVEQYEVVGGQGGGKDEVGAHVSGNGVDEILQQRLWKRNVTANGGEEGIGAGTDAVAEDGNGAKAGIAVTGDPPDEIGHAQIEGPHQAIRRI